jgi:hypothetical protein
MTNAESMMKSESVAHASSVPGSAALLDLFSANGAYQPSLGQRPREVEPSRAQALKARFIQRWYLGQAESRFQRWVLLYSRSWGVAPGYHETAPLALSSDYQLIVPKGSRMLRHYACHETIPCGRGDRTTCLRSPSFRLTTLLINVVATPLWGVTPGFERRAPERRTAPWLQGVRIYETTFDHLVIPSSLDIRHSSFFRHVYATDDGRIRGKSQCLP